MENLPPIKIIFKEGPVLIPSLHGQRVDATYDLWGGISASEFFPLHVDSAFYVLSLSKFASRHDDASTVEAELLAAYKLLARAWPFCGGSFIVKETYHLLQIRSYESNSEAVQRQLLDREGLQDVTKTFSVGAEVLVTYSQAPLDAARQVAKAMHGDPSLAKLLHYHQLAWVAYYRHPGGQRSSSWSTDLYKVRDFLVEDFGNGNTARTSLNISEADWSFFGNILNNNDLRHGETGIAPALPTADVDQLFRLAKAWIRSYLRKKGLPVASS